MLGLLIGGGGGGGGGARSCSLKLPSNSFNVWVFERRFRLLAITGGGDLPCTWI
jgi:hypothetical protein